MSNKRPVNDIGLDEPSPRDKLPKINNKRNMQQQPPSSRGSEDSPTNQKGQLTVPRGGASRGRRGSASSVGSGGSAGSRRSVGNKENSAANRQKEPNKYVRSAGEPRFDGEPASLQRSFLLTNNDRHQQEQQYLRPLQSGGGLMSSAQNIEAVGLMAKKIEYFGIN